MPLQSDAPLPSFLCLNPPRIMIDDILGNVYLHLPCRTCQLIAEPPRSGGGHTLRSSACCHFDVLAIGTDADSSFHFIGGDDSSNHGSYDRGGA